MPVELCPAKKVTLSSERVLFAVKIRGDLLDLVPEFLVPDENGNYSETAKHLCLAALNAKFNNHNAKEKIPHQLVTKLLKKDLGISA